MVSPGFHVSKNRYLFRQWVLGGSSLVIQWLKSSDPWCCLHLAQKVVGIEICGGELCRVVGNRDRPIEICT